MIKIHLYLLLLGFFLLTNPTLGQNSINASGSDASGNGGAVSYSVGQIVYQSYSDNTFNIAEGVQQAFEVSTLSVSTPNLRNASLSVYPNPTSHSVVVGLEEFRDENVSYQLFDIQGRLLQTGLIRTRQHTIKMNELSPATYLLVIRNQNDKELTTFKIIKH